MIEPPSSHLVQTLLELKLCSTADLRRCRGRVKRLARDLPAFDTVWIDALLQARRLTAFQAGILDSSTPQRICVGPCVLIDKLGGRAGAHTFLARQRDGDERCALKLIDCPADVAAAPLARLEDLVERTRASAHPSIVAPRTAMCVGEQIALVSRYVPGPHLGQLLVRRGRFPAHVVAELATQLIDGLASIEEQGSAHGDVRLANVRLTEHGVAVLVDYGVRPAVEPEFSIHSTLTPEYCDGIAPELIGTGKPPSASSDLYALGCLLWQLLAGRPPFMTADPLAKLACHQTRRIVDVRDIAPDVSASLAESIRLFTSPDVGDRPQSFRDVRQNWKPPKRAGRRRLAEFGALFNSAAPRVPMAAREASTSKWPLLVVLLFVLSGATLSLVDKGAASLPLAIREVRWPWFHDTTPEEPAAAPDSAVSQKPETSRAMPAGFPSLPAPDADGVIVLDTDGPYSCGRIDQVGSLTIRGAANRRPIIVVDHEPLFVISASLAFENVHMRRGGRLAISKANTPLLTVRAQTFSIKDCSFILEAQATPISNHSTLAAIDWRPVNSGDQNAGQIAMQNTVFIGGSAAMSLEAPPKAFQATNCLKRGHGPFLALSHAPKPQHSFHSNLRQVTLRDCSSLMEVRLAGKPTPAGLIAVETTDSVFHFMPGILGLLQFISNEEVTAANIRIDVIGEGTLAHPNFEIATWINPAGKSSAPLQGDSIALEGISAVPLEFAGVADTNPGNSTIRSSGGPQRSTVPPGIDASLLRVPAYSQSAELH